MATRITHADVLDQPQRRRIFEEVRQSPGISWMELGRRVGVTPTTVRWHLQKLEWAGLIVTETYLGYRLAHLAHTGIPGKRIGRAHAIVNDPRNAEIVALAEAGFSAPDIRARQQTNEERLTAILQAVQTIQYVRSQRLEWGITQGLARIHNGPVPG